MKKKNILILVLFLCTKLLFAQEKYLGEIRIFAGNFAPIGWEKCEGQLLSISQNEALFSLIGTTYGGDGQATFALPDYRGRAVIGTSTSPQIALGTMLGQEEITLTQANLPTHTHTASLKVSSAKATATTPTNNSSLAAPAMTVNSITRDALGYSTATPNTPLLPTVSTPAGSSSQSPISLMQPYLVITYIIATEGVYPTGN